MSGSHPEDASRPAAESLLPELRSACEDLLWLSETDAPFEVICWPEQPPPLTPQDLLRLGGCPADTPIQTSRLEDFFGPATTEQDWFGAAEKAQAERYRHLQHLLTSRLEDPQVYRLGEVEVTIYVLGYTGDGQLAGVKTFAVET